MDPSRTYLPAAIVLVLGLAGMVYLGMRDSDRPTSRRTTVISPDGVAAEQQAPGSTARPPAAEAPVGSTDVPSRPSGAAGTTEPRDIKEQLRASGELPELGSPSVDRPGANAAPRGGSTPRSNVASSGGSGPPDRRVTVPMSGGGGSGSPSRGGSPTGRSGSTTTSSAGGAPAGSTFGASQATPTTSSSSASENEGGGSSSSSNPPVSDPPDSISEDDPSRQPDPFDDDDDDVSRDEDEPPPTALVTMEPAGGVATVGVGEQVSLVIRIAAGTDVGHVPFHVSFDPNVLSFEIGQQGSFLSSDGWQTAFFATPTTSGNTVVVGLSRLGAAEGVNGGGELCTLHFTAVGSGPAQLTFQSAKVKNSQNTIVPSLFTAAPVTVL